MTDQDCVRDAVRVRYAQAAARALRGDYEEARRQEASCCAGRAEASSGSSTVFGPDLYGAGAADGATEAALAASLGCGVPTAVADLHPGEVVLDLGSGAGADVLISARRVAPGGRVIGLDMTEQMLELARRNATEAGVDNVEFVRGYLEDIPLPEASVDVVISNCVINLAADKRRVLAEAARVLRPAGRFAVSDVLADEGMDEATRADMAAWTGCIAGALTRAQYTALLSSVGLVDLEISETHRVHQHASAAIICAQKPLSSSETPAT
jgi:SAM-dependent methyltransferase